MAAIEYWYDQDLKKPVKIRVMDGCAFTQDNIGTLIGVKVYDNGEPVTLTGTVNGYCILPDGTTAPISGTRSGNTAYIKLTQGVLAYSGSMRVTIKLTNGNEITTLLAVFVTVSLSKTDTVITPSSQVIEDWSQEISESLQDMEDQLDDKIDKFNNAEDGNIPTINGSGGLTDSQIHISELLQKVNKSAIAPTYANLTYPVQLNQLCWHSGTLYRAKQPIGSSETWDSSHWEEADVAAVLSKKADKTTVDGQLNGKIDKFNNPEDGNVPTINGGGGLSDSQLHISDFWRKNSDFTKIIPVSGSTESSSYKTLTATHTGFTYRDGEVFQLVVPESVTYPGWLRLNINNAGAKTVTVDGVTMSSSEETLAAGVYQVVCKSSLYYLSRSTAIGMKVDVSTAPPSSYDDSSIPSSGLMKKLLDDKADLDIISDNIETTSQASKAYSIGDTLILQGKLYNVIKPIAQGDYFGASGADANIEETTVGEEVTNLNGEVSDLKSAFDDNDSATKSIQAWLGEGIIYKNSISHGSAVSYNTTKTEVNAEAGWGVKVKIVDEANTSKSFVLYTKYEEDDSATNIATVTQGSEYNFVSVKTLEYIGIYQTELTSGTAIITATVTNPNGFEQKEPVIESDILALQRETGIEKTFSKELAHSTSISFDNSKFAVYAEQGWEVSVLTEDSNNNGFGYTIYVKYKEDQSATSLGFVGVEGTDYKFVSAKTLEYIAIYVTSISSGTVTISATVHNPNGVKQKIEEKVDIEGFGQITTDNLEDVTSNVLYKRDSITVAGSTSYVNQIILTYNGTFKAGDKFNILCDSVTGASAVSPYGIYLKNSSDTDIRQRQYADIEITQSDINSGLDHANFSLYPAKGTKLPSGSATYTNVRIVKGETEEYSLTGNLAQAVKSITGDDAGVVPEYFLENDYLDTKAARINQLAEQCAGNGDVFLFITDEHYDIGYNQKHSPAIIEYLCKKCKIPRLFDGGDTANGASIEWIEMIHSAFKHDTHHIMGNHDWMLDRSGDYLAYYFDSYGFNQVGHADKHYYYVDNEQKKIRYIILNAWKSDLTQSNTLVSAYDTDQLNWFTNTALDVETGWGIIVFTHYIKVGSNINPSGALDFLNAMDNYNGNGEIICVIEGHTHFDSVSHTQGGIPIINTTCDKNGSWISEGTNMEPWLDEQRPDGTIYEQAFDVFCINRETRKIKAVRIGALAMDNVDKTYGSQDFTTDGTLEEREISY